MDGACEAEQTTLGPPDVFSARHLLLECLEEETEQLLGIIRSYVRRFNLALGDQAVTVALEVLQEVAVEALEHADRFAIRHTRQPRAWLLGIALNVIRRKRVEEARRSRREWQLGRLSGLHPEAANEHELLDQLMQSQAEDPEQEFLSKEQVSAMLSLVAEEDREILRLAFLEGFQREALAQWLGTAPSTARMRLHRALGRLRSAWRQYDTPEKGVGDE